MAAVTPMLALAAGFLRLRLIARGAGRHLASTGAEGPPGPVVGCRRPCGEGSTSAETARRAGRLLQHMTTAFALIVFLALLGVPSAAAGARPNILLIYSDDHGWADLGAQGVDKDIRTPHLDQLARDGVRFTHGYVTAPQCTPSRAGVITGRYQSRFGVEHNGIGMQPETVTLAERLQAAGYVTGLCGKWHLDIENIGTGGQKKNFVNPDLHPRRQGFDEYFSGFLQDYSASHALDGTPFPDAPRPVTEQGCRVTIQTEAALSFLNRREAEPARPWFLFLSFMAPHVPLESPEPWFSQTPAHLPEKRRKALAMIAAMDDGLGRIREQLRAMNAETNTLIFFIGDNGAPLGDAWDGSLNLPLKGQKGMLAEGGIRVPFVAAWPGRIPATQVFEPPVISLDVAATAVEAAGVPAPSATAEAGPALDGVNLLPFLTGETVGPPHETLYWRWMSQAAVLEFPWKLVALGDRERLLFNISTPEGESAQRNLAQAKPEIAARLEAKLQAWSAQLQPPGLLTNFDRHHEALFGTHGIVAVTNRVAEEAATDATVLGWLCRNGTLEFRDGALAIVPTNAASNARAFIAHRSLDLPAPVTATLRVRAKQGAPATLTWRTKTDSFTPTQTATFDWPAGEPWRDVTVALPDRGRLIHLRINPGRNAAGLEIQRIELRGKTGPAQEWNFARESAP
jgi:uncharacterized sulfatase